MIVHYNLRERKLNFYADQLKPDAFFLNMTSEYNRTVFSKSLRVGPPIDNKVVALIKDSGSHRV